jgi:hypothetical protein
VNVDQSILAINRTSLSINVYPLMSLLADAREASYTRSGYLVDVTLLVEQLAGPRISGEVQIAALVVPTRSTYNSIRRDAQRGHRRPSIRNH